MILLGILCGIDALVAVTVLVFFFWGLADGTVSAFNIGLWMAVLSAIAAMFGGGIALWAYGQRLLASLILAVLAAPGVLYGFFVLLILVLEPDWK